MQDTRCVCGKIVYQTDGLKIIIQCRHCKRRVMISTKGGDAEGLAIIPKALMSPETLESRGQQF